MNAVAKLAAEIRAKRLPHHLARTMRSEGLVAVTLRGPIGAVPRHFGDNMGARPVKLSTTTVWRDEIGRRCDLEHYIETEHKTLVRVWTIGEVWASRLAEGIRERVLSGGQEMRNGWVDLGHDMDDGDLLDVCLDVSHHVGIKAWSDVGIVTLVEDLHRHEMLRRELG